MKRFAARLLAYGAAAIPCAVFLAFQGAGHGVQGGAQARAADPVVTAGIGSAAGARVRR